MTPTKTIESKADIIEALRMSFEKVANCLINTPSEILHLNKDEKWSVAENFDHLIRSTKPVASALKKNKFFFLPFGISLSGSEEYEILKTNYHLRISQGVTPPKAYLPLAGDNLSKDKMLTSWKVISEKFPERISKWSEKDLNRFRVPHPALGKVTLRELLFFTIFHNEHHLKRMNIINNFS
ncbi:MAG: DinB family protein [Bacteroidota bacterium]